MIDPTSFELVFDATIALSVQTEIAIVAAVYEVYDLCVCMFVLPQKPLHYWKLIASIYFQSLVYDFVLFYHALSYHALCRNR